MSLRTLTVAALVSLALGFSSTTPVVSWSSYSSNALDSIPSKLPHSHSVLDSILSNEDVCGHDAVVLVDQPDLHASDLRVLPSHAHLSRSLLSAPSSRQFPYVSSTGLDFSSLLESTATRCQSRIVSYSPGHGGVSFSNEKHVVSLSFPALNGLADERAEAMLKHDSLLSAELALLAKTFPNHLVIYTSSSPSSLAKRADTVLGSVIQAPSAKPKTKGGVLARYQLLTPGLIVTLFVAFFVLVPIFMAGFSALASIQSSVQTSTPKSFDAAAKKNQ
ncbi:unnamed protein product [Mycena citricolor]|uniref:Protein BIG1 n=1 Tax=Mycena citricolor TaxID=2018698 RepID=A0AAD2Q1T5_9AGAR|nr:unnamed protein product [Mycena citricolor]